MRDKETITIPLNKVSYEELEALTIEQQTQLFVKDKEIERLNNNWNELRTWIVYNKHNENTEERYLVVDYGTLLGKMSELKEVELTENDKKQVKWLKEEFEVGVDKE